MEKSAAVFVFGENIAADEPEKISCGGWWYYDSGSLETPFVISVIK
jgi:hypothetical protein